MRKFTFKKLVRDKIVDLQISSGAKPHYIKLSDEEHKQQLIKKLLEETNEIANASPNNIVSEIADVQQVIDDLRQKYRITKKEVVQAQKFKRNKNGAFKKGLYVEFIEVPENHAWLDYYLNNPDRYPEIN